MGTVGLTRGWSALLIAAALVALTPPLEARERQPPRTVDLRRVELLVLGQGSASRSKLTPGQRSQLEVVAKRFREKRSGPRQADLARYVRNFDQPALTNQNLDAVLGRVLYVTWSHEAPQLSSQLSRLGKHFAAAERLRGILHCSQDAASSWRTPLELTKAACSPRAPLSSAQTRAMSQLESLAKAARAAEEASRTPGRSVLETLFIVFGESTEESNDDKAYWLVKIETQNGAGSSAEKELKAKLLKLYVQFENAKQQCKQGNLQACETAADLLAQIAELEAQLAAL